ncbi:MAG: HI0074 family nucleotidyltransferase substrate-binding subunit [Bdellovibrionales bacterium]|nr:HI0074 family nucleotidyltransferase substrate-binding subunit [Bdellovibrionales bacterium]
MAAVSILEYEKALNSLKESLQAFQTQNEPKLKEMLRDASIQRFEFACELAWKVSMKVLGLSTSSPKMALREMVQSSLIDDFQVWFDYIEARNKSSHSYDEKIALEVILKAQQFISSAEDLLKKLKSK